MALNLAAPTQCTQESAAIHADSIPPVPSLESIVAAFPQLEVEGLIGRGGMGAVFKARQPRLNRFVALKILPEKLASQPAFASRFAQEGQLLARLAHPNIVAVHDFGQAGGFFYLIMEYVDGVNLRQALQASRFTPAQALAIVPKICDALQYAHDEGVLHRDIKPENILLDQKGRVKLADFGIAKLVQAGSEEHGDASPDAAEAGRPESLTGAADQLGTPAYMSPEQRERRSPIDHRADIYSLGVVFYELLTGQLPTATLVPPSQHGAIDPRVDDVVRRALATPPHERYPSVRDLKTQLEEITRTGPSAASTPPVLRRPQFDQGKPAWLSRRSIAAFAVLFGIATAITLAALRRASQQRLLEASALARLAEEQARAARTRFQTMSPEEQESPSTATKPDSIALHLIASGPFKNVAIARTESMAGQPIHQVIVHFAGPPIPEVKWQDARNLVGGPVLHPSSEEAPDVTWRPPPVDNVALYAKDTRPDKPGSAWFEAPGECQLEFAFASGPDATEASRQINEALAKPVQLAFGVHLTLFQVGAWTGWLEAAPYPTTPAFSVRRSLSRSPAYGKGGLSNGMEVALVTLPPNVDLTITTTLTRMEETRDRALKEIVLSNTSSQTGLYWVDWYTLPSENFAHQWPKPAWAMHVHDARTAVELLSIHSDDEDQKEHTRLPDGFGWVRRQVSDLDFPSDKPISLNGLLTGQSPSVPDASWVGITFTSRPRAVRASKY